MSERARQTRMRLQKENKKEQLRKKRKKELALQWGAVALVILALVYIVYDKVRDRGTIDCRSYVCGQKVSHLTEEEAADKVQKKFTDTVVNFVENGKSVYKVTLGEAGYALDRESLLGELGKIEAEQRSCLGLIQPWRNYKIACEVTQQEEQKRAAFAASHFQEGKERRASRDAGVFYDQEQKKYVSVPQEQGNQIDEGKLLTVAEKTIDESLQENLLAKSIKVPVDLETYQTPKISDEDAALQEEVDIMNERLQNYPLSSVTYTFGDVEETLDSATIQSWIVQEENGIHLDEEAVRAYVKELSAKYDTMYVVREFETSLDFTVDVERNNYGYLIDEEAEYQQLEADIASGQAVRREPIYSEQGMHRNGNDDLLGSYIEVSIYNQYLWLYRDGVLITETPVVTGQPVGFNAMTGEQEDWSTLYGAYSIAYKQSPSVLSSEIYGYETEVNYWMPFEDGQGLHDATWKSEFGGNIYTYAGSHGCVNLPLDQAAVIYANIDAGYPIIIY